MGSPHCSNNPICVPLSNDALTDDTEAASFHLLVYGRDLDAQNVAELWAALQRLSAFESGTGNHASSHIFY